MHRKWLLFVLIPAVLLIGGYIAIQVFLRSRIDKEEKKESQVAATSDSLGSKTDTLGGKKVSDLDLRPLFIQHMQQLLQKSSNGLYNLSVGDLDIDVLASVVSLRNVSISPDADVLKRLKAAGEAPGDVLSLNFQSLTIEGINVDDAITSKTMDYKLIRLINPVVEIVHRRSKGKKAGGEFSQRFLKEMKSLSIGKLLMDEGRIVVRDEEKGTTKKLANVALAMNNILVNEDTRADSTRFLFAKEAQLEFHNFSTTTPDGLYNFKIGSAFVNASQKKVQLKNVSFASGLSKEAFVQKQKVAKEMYNLSLPSITVNGTDWWAALNGDEVKADGVQTSGGKFSVYFDRDLPPRNRMGNFPNQLLQKLSFQLSINNLKMRGFDISYEERNPVSQQSGTVYLDNASLEMENVSSAGGKPVTVTGTALLMHKIPIRATFRFDMKRARSGQFSAALSADKPFEARLLNPIAEPLGMMKLENGSLQKLQATMTGNESGAGGDVQVLYNDLKLSLLEKEKGEKTLDKKDVTTLLANLFVLKKDNPKGGKAPRKVQAEFRRDPNGGFVMLVWKTVLVGVLKTIGAPEKMAYKKPK